MEGMVVCSANYVPLTPISFLERAAFVYGQRVSMVFGDTRYLWKETHERCIRLASALSQLGITSGDIVAAVAPNIPELYELQFGVPMTGAVLCALNPKLNATTLAVKLQQLEAKAIFVDYEFTKVVLEALGSLSQTKNNSPVLILIQENHTNASSATPINFRLDYHALLATGKLDFDISYPKSECDPISICYTSGSTSKPKGVIYSHRAAYLNSLGEIFRIGMRQKPVFLWTVDMFRCNGWCFPWTMAALGGTNICLRDVTGTAILNSIFLHDVTLFCGPPILLSKIAETLAADPQPLPQKVDVIVAGAGALPEPQIQTKLGELGFNIICAYGMSEALGPVTSRTIRRSCHGVTSQLDHEDARTRIREGTHNLIIEGADVKHPTTMESVPADGKTVGQIMFRSNTLMSGYLKNAQATEEAFEGGWYRTKDLGVKHPDGYIQMKDRAIDVINSGGEIVSSLEIEGVIIRHPMVSEVAVVGRPDELLGETPCAFVKLKDGCCIVEEEIMDICASHLPEHMRPKSVFFGELPVNSTGKVQKFVLRDRLIKGDGKSL
ncbi:butanoate--CoA ligase AAE1 [Coffea arabica]|uniref:Probable acyl-activating enzyme 1, peroxisomal n=1 Tax=Coffea arabica TaxID=13443 RepID=A0A6P6THM5_COFAR|nr:probable acyl-activating enzyme 1, peroxisomal [Coffea arabica]XP_027077994.1 probable acyl-activating enzyme 1, peroxisomal [Coffea arabica]